MKMSDEAREARARFIRAQTPRRELLAFIGGGLAVIIIVCLALRMIPS